MPQTKSHAISFRLDQDLHPTVKKWLAKNPGLNVSRLANLAIRRFVTSDQTLESVETVVAKKKDVRAALKKMMRQHKKTLEELK